MANNKKISQLGLAGGLTGIELVPVVKAGVTVQTTTQEIADLLGGSSTTPTLQDVVTENNTVDGVVYQSLDGSSTVTMYNSQQQTTVGNGVDSTTIQHSPTAIEFTGASVTRNGDEIATVDNLANYLPLAGGALTGLLKEAKSINIASATTTDLSTATGNLVHITGTTTITSFGTVQAGTTIKVIFDGILTLTHNATSLILPGGANIITGAGDSALLVSEGSGNWKCMFYQSAGSGLGTWTPTFTGYSVIPSTYTAGYYLSGNLVTVSYSTDGTTGTSNATSLTITLPFISKYTNFGIPVIVQNSGATKDGVGRMVLTSGSNIASFNLTPGAGSFTSSGLKNVWFNISYVIQ